jgi:hypothetical protein
MALSDSARHILAEASQHPLRLAAPPDKLPAAACGAMLNSLLQQGYVEECSVQSAELPGRQRCRSVLSSQPPVARLEIALRASVLSDRLPHRSLNGAHRIAVGKPRQIL